MNSAAEPRIEVIRRLQAAAARRDLAALLEFFAPDVEYHYHVGSRPLQGRAWVERFFSRYWAHHSAATWVIEHWAERDGRLFTEGREEYTNADGVRVVHPYMGIIEFGADGRITGWRDYFQMNDPNATARPA
ncbi:MAG: nuclear transport factor 2 family protein [Steroidobacteraceae bacterium]